ncbi:acyl-CoA dehydrogenase [Spongiibacter sp. IMCC21906]|uniref:acyl-CoA dehydrogenase n=1 Tax=Spongiibacter sp. IMCC21906 TaxID=1620392 RepID=UPI00062DD68B|nr:acyl-CoA dehydrogenase [Spongiibacter sp. IMCC21906]AKH68687.1 acyl-CoA dehydrogenase [Spongiibacter sp. IMCC21906]
MNLYLTDEQNMLQESVARLLATESNGERIRAAEASGFDPALWQQLQNMGLNLMRLPEQAGGLDSSLLDAVLVAEQAGRHLASVPLIEHMAASRLLAKIAAAGSDAASSALAQLAEGSLITFLPQRFVNTQAPLNGAVVADHVLLADENAIYLLSAEHFSPVANLASGALGQLKDSVELSAFLVAQGTEMLAEFDAACDEWRLLCAAALGGLAEQGLRMAAEYANERKAFGVPISSFQGISHPLADAISQAEGTQLLTRKAVWALAAARSDASASVAMAFWWAAETSSKAMAKALHTFGGYGVSLEYDIQMYYRRAKAWPACAGDAQRALLDAADRLWPSQRSVSAESKLPDAGDNHQDYSLGAEAEAFAEQTRAFFAKHMTPELRAHAHHSVDGFHPEFNKLAAKEGMLFPHWPKEYGGLDKSAYDLAAMTAVIEAEGWEHVTAPITNQVAQIVMRFGTEEAKAESLERFGSGESLACMGFTEPSCGCDVFAAKTVAEEQNNGDWLINGQKIFTTAANLADYCFLLARTNNDKPKHAGLSVFLVPMTLPGIEVHAVHTLQDERTNIVYFSDVNLPAKYLVGEVDGGLKVMASTLEMEHGSADQYRHGHVTAFHAAEKWALQNQRNGKPLLVDNQAAARLARSKVHLEVSTLLCYRAIWCMSEKIHNRYWGPMAKLFATEYYQRDADDLMDLCAPYSVIQQRDGLGHLEVGYRQSIGTTIYGGTSEVQRSLVAEQALGLARSRG